MISGQGWVACFKKAVDVSGEQRFVFTDKPVVYFDSDGRGWVPDAENGLANAETDYSNFAGYRPEGIAQIVPARGVSAVYKDDDGGEYRSPVNLWALKADGDVAPLVSDSRGIVDEPNQDENFLRLEFADEEL
jgi:hypothetical protein